MSLFDAAYSATPADFNVHGVSGGNPAELVTRLQAAIVAAITAGESSIIDFKLGGTGAGPNWEAWFVTTSGEPDSFTVPLQEAFVAGGVGGNPTEAVLALRANLAVLAPTAVYKIEVAGGGIGTIFLALALVLVEPD